MNGPDYTGKVRFLSRRWWLQGTKTFSWVALVTLLVWVYADMEYTDQEEFKATIRLTTDSDSGLVLVDEEGTTVSMLDTRLSFELRGNRKMLDRFKRQLSADDGGIIKYMVTGEYDPGPHEIDAAEIVKRARGLEGQGLTLLSTSKPTVEVFLDKLLTREFKATFRLTVDSASDVVPVSSEGGARVPMLNVKASFRLRGTGKRLDRFGRQLSARDGVLEYEVTGEYGPGTHPIDAARIVRKAGLLEKQGLTLMSTSPETAEIILDKLSTRMVRVRFVPTGATLDGEPVILPPEVPVRVTAGTWKKIVAAQTDPRLDTVSTDLTGVSTENGVATKRVALTGNLAGFPVELDPKTDHVTVRFRIAERMSEKELKLSVRVQAPPEWGEKGIWTTHTLQRKDEIEWWPTVTVRGPQKDLEKLLAAPKVDPKIDAYIKLNDENVREVDSWMRQSVTIKFPPDLRVQLVNKAPEVQLKFVKRGAVPAMP